MTHPPEDLPTRRRRIRYRAWHRGMRELDLLLGRYVDATIDAMDDKALDALETLMAAPEPQVMAWLTAAEPVPADQSLALIEAIRSFHRDQPVSSNPS